MGPLRLLVYAGYRLGTIVLVSSCFSMALVLICVCPVVLLHVLGGVYHGEGTAHISGRSQA